jgi:HSP20 family protein
MASIYHLNQPSNQFWDFTNGNLEDHPFFAPRGHHGHHGRHAGGGPKHDSHPDATEAENTEQTGEKGEASASDSDSPDNHHRRCNHCGKGKGKARGGPGHHGPGPFRGNGGKGKHGRGHHGFKRMQPTDGTQQSDAPRAADESNANPSIPNDNSESSSESESPDNHRRYGKCKNKGHGPGHHGPGPFRGKGGRGKHGHGPYAGPYDFHGHGHSHGHHGPGAFGLGGPGRHSMGKHGHGYGPHAGPYGFPGHHHGGPFEFGPRGHRGGHGRYGRHDRPPFGGPFDFLHQIGAGLRLPMNGPAHGTDFMPAVDVFDTPARYIVHASLPGAKKGDLSIDYNAEESVLHLAGVVNRPGVSEDLHQALVMEERGQEVGVFEREIRFGTRVAPAPVLVDGISAKLEDGVLNITLPKTVQDSQVMKKKVFVENGDENEKDAMVVERTYTPVESEESDNEGEAREYVKVPVL